MDPPIERDEIFSSGARFSSSARMREPLARLFCRECGTSAGIEVNSVRGISNPRKHGLFPAAGKWQFLHFCPLYKPDKIKRLRPGLFLAA